MNEPKASKRRPDTPVDVPDVRAAALKAASDSRLVAADDTFTRLASPEIAALIAHEIRNLMTPLLGYVQLARREPGDVDLVLRALERAELLSRRAGDIAESILLLQAPADAGCHSGAHASVAIAAAEAVLCAVEPNASGGTPITVDVADSLQAAIDPGWLQQILTNLLLNARRAMAGRSGGISICARHESMPQQGDGDSAAAGHGDPQCSTWNHGWIAIDVADQGPGLPPDLAARLSATPASDIPALAGDSGGVASTSVRRSDARQRRGLGLHLSELLVQAAGGQLELAENSPCGATLRVRLPAALPTTQQAAQPAPQGGAIGSPSQVNPASPSPEASRLRRTA